MPVLVSNTGNLKECVLYLCLPFPTPLLLIWEVSNSGNPENPPLGDPLRLFSIGRLTVWPRTFPGRSWSPPASSDVWSHCTYGEEHPSPRWNPHVPIQECSYGRWDWSPRRAASSRPLDWKASPDPQSTLQWGPSCLWLYTLWELARKKE